MEKKSGLTSYLLDVERTAEFRSTVHVESPRCARVESSHFHEGTHDDAKFLFLKPGLVGVFVDARRRVEVCLVV